MTKILPRAIGKMACLCCGEQITVKQADTGTVSVSCPDCDFSGYGKTGTDAHRRIMARVTLKAQPVEPTPAAKPTLVKQAPSANPHAPEPVRVVRNTVFG